MQQQVDLLQPRTINNQLHLNALHLQSYGLIQTIVGDKVIYKKSTVNGYFYYNPLERMYVWYHKTIIGDNSNDVCLNIQTEQALQLLLNIWG